MEKDKYEVYGIPVRDYWNEAETEMEKGMRIVLGNVGSLDQETVSQYIIDYCNMVQVQTFDDAGDQWPISGLMERGTNDRIY